MQDKGTNRGIWDGGDAQTPQNVPSAGRDPAGWGIPKSPGIGSCWWGHIGLGSHQCGVTPSPTLVEWGDFGGSHSYQVDFRETPFLPGEFEGSHSCQVDLGEITFLSGGFLGESHSCQVDLGEQNEFPTSQQPSLDLGSKEMGMF